MKATIYEAMQEIGAEMDHHESDLYVKKTPETEAIVKAWDYRPIATTFKSQVDGEIWFDLPFAYKPYWDRIEGAIK